MFLVGRVILGFSCVAGQQTRSTKAASRKPPRGCRRRANLKRRRSPSTTLHKRKAPPNEGVGDVGVGASGPVPLRPVRAAELGGRVRLPGQPHTVSTTYLRKEWR